MSTHAPLLFGKYKLLELIARGGMAEVFRAKSFGVEGFEKLVVIKRILPDLAQNPGFVEMFINEAKLSVALSHANIVQVFDLGREEDTYFIAMEHVNGMDLGEALRRARRAGTRAPMELCVFVASEMARALDYAHRRRDAQMRPLNIVHRDVSPQNVLLSYEGEVKVTDFGIAKARKTIDEAGSIKGKFGYMAPEQARGADVDARADVYALGVVLYEALAGRNPFQASTPYETMRRVQAGEKPPVHLAAPDVPADLARIVETALAPDPDARYPSAAKMYEDLTGFLYTTGKRVAGHDLAEWLQALRDAPARDDESHRMRDAFEDVDPDANKTPVEVPASASHASRPGRGSSSGLARPHLERRDVTLVALELEAPTRPTADDPLDQLAAVAVRYGAAIADRSDAHLVMVFGAREPDGRDTEAALRCALKLEQAARRHAGALEVGLGVHPARLHVGAEGEPERDERFTSALALVRDLARAAERRVLASEPVGRLAAESFNLSPVTGRSGAFARVPGTALEVLGERSPYEGARRRYFGRKDAFRRFGDILARAHRQGSSAVAVVGEAGTGKSRFLAEVHYRLRKINQPVAWYTATSLPPDRDVPLSALQAMLRAVVGVEETGADVVVQERIGRLRELGVTGDELRAMGAVLGAGVAPEALQGSARPLRSAVVKVATRLAQDQLTVFAWDGAENMDDDSAALVHELLGAAGRARVVVVLACRPGFIYPWSDEAAVDEITLGPLTEDEARELVAYRLGAPRVEDVPAELFDDLWNKSSGNPLFLEEYLKALGESGAVEVRDAVVHYRREVAEVGVPKTLRGLVASRVARLSPAQRILLQVAAVVGTRFHRDVLAEVGELQGPALDAALRTLAERGIVARVGGDEHGFAHELLREVVYEGLTLETRRELHAAVALATERLFGDRLDELAERLAHHYRESNDRVRAVAFLERAARRQVSELAFGAAAANMARAVELVLASPQPDAAQVIALCSDLGRAALRGRQALGIAIEKLRLGLWYAEEIGDRDATVRLLILLGQLLAHEHRVVDAAAFLERAHALVRHDAEGAELGEVSTTLGDLYARNGEFRRAVQHLEEAVRVAEARGEARDAALALLALARCHAAAGDRARALATWEHAAAAVDAVDSVADASLRVEAEKTLGIVHFHTRDFARAAEHSARAVELAREYALAYEQAAAAHNCGDAWLRLGDYRKAFTWLKTSLDVAQEHGYEKLAQLDGLFLAFIDAAKFGSQEAHARVAAALAYAEAQGFTWDVLHAKYLLAQLARDRGDREQASRLLREALTLAAETGNQMYVEDCETLLRDLRSVPPAAPNAAPA